MNPYWLNSQTVLRDPFDIYQAATAGTSNDVISNAGRCGFYAARVHYGYDRRVSRSDAGLVRYCATYLNTAQGV